jgi:hypothetical protein
VSLELNFILYFSALFGLISNFNLSSITTKFITESSFIAPFFSVIIKVLLFILDKMTDNSFVLEKGINKI